MVAYSFKSQFATPILAGTKGGTIRADRKRHARPGELVQLYTGMRTKACWLITERECLACEPIELHLAVGEVCGLWGEIQGRDNLDLFARFDGFESWRELCTFWDETRGVANFAGWHIRWAPLPEWL